MVSPGSEKTKGTHSTNVCTMSTLSLSGTRAYVVSLVDGVGVTPVVNPPDLLGGRGVYNLG